MRRFPAQALNEGAMAAPSVPDTRIREVRPGVW